MTEDIQFTCPYMFMTQVITVSSVCYASRVALIHLSVSTQYLDFLHHSKFEFRGVKGEFWYF